MAMHIDELEFLCKDPNSHTGSCPAFYGARVAGGFVVQGKRLDDATKAQLRDLAADEDAVFVPTELVDRFVEGL